MSKSIKLSKRSQKTLAVLNDASKAQAASNQEATKVHGYDVHALPNGMKVLSRKHKASNMVQPAMTLLDAANDPAPLQKSSKAHWIKGKQVAKRQAIDRQIKQLKDHNYQLLRRLKNSLDTGKMELAFKFIDLIANARKRQQELNVQWKAIQDGIAIAEKVLVPKPSPFKTTVKRKTYKMWSEK